MADSAYDYAPTVMFDGVYRMWWCGQAPEQKVPGDDILYAESSSPDGPFQARGSAAPHQIVFEGTGNGSFDNEHTCDPSVVRVNGTYYLYYGAERHDGEPTTIGVASSPDGFNWTRVNNDQPIIAPANQQNTGNTYGAGQPSAIYLDGFFYLMFTDTTGAGALGNGAGQFVWRSPDPAFQSQVESFTAAGWQSKTVANSRSFSVANAFSADWQYSDALRAFIIAHDNAPGQTTLTFLDPNNLAKQAYADVTIPGQWTEGPGVVSRPDKHSPVSGTNDCGRIPVDVIRSTTSYPPRQLAHIGLDLLSGTSCAAMPPRQIAAIYEGYGLQFPGLPAAVVVSGRRLQVEDIATYSDLTHNAMYVPRSIYDAIPYGASLHYGETVLGASGRPGAFQLDNDTLWPVSCPQLVTDNHSSITMVEPKTWLSYLKGPGLFCLSSGPGSGPGTLYRCYNPGNGHHMDTTDPGCEGYPHRDGILWTISPTQIPGTVPLYRCYNPGNGDHMDTTDPGCEGYLHRDGVLGYLFPTRVPGSVTLYRCYSPGNGDHLTSFIFNCEGYPQKDGVLGYTIT
ncbi:beta-xylosidase [Streptomyces sp. AK02-04a]|uniref:beta-xylosidase n=1 Tax=Streptomyces sp. AK02-04a TaxID=3028649 RepID=UPI0029BF5AFA|nr:beta-xylosidase [Streptomyces sp. AK02-04a]MDX3763531.1 beta-xylosidase [Streptomyces sp. AK02-04a]